MFPETLLDCLWHTTSVVRFKGIVTSTAIVPEPNIPDSERWGTSKGIKYFPFVRVIGGVSLFDFTAFDPEAYTKKYPISSWSSFVPNQAKWKNAVWIEIDRTTVKDNLIEGKDLLKKWHSEKMYTHNIMPHIECCHIGKLTIDKFKRVLLYDGNSKLFTIINRC